MSDNDAILTIDTIEQLDMIIRLWEHNARCPVCGQICGKTNGILHWHLHKDTVCAGSETKVSNE